MGRRDSQFQILPFPWGTKTRMKTSSPGEKPGHPESLCRAPCLCWGPNHVSYHLPLPPPCSPPVSWPVHQLGVLTRARLAHVHLWLSFCTAQRGAAAPAGPLGLWKCRFLAARVQTWDSWAAAGPGVSSTWVSAQVRARPGFPGWQNPPANAGDLRDVGSIPGLGRSLGERNGNPLHCSCLENPMDRGAWRATELGVIQGWI